MTHTTECCGAPRAMWMDDGGAFEAQCRDCGDNVCTRCAGSWADDGGYDEGGRGTRTFALCRICTDARHDAETSMEAR